MTRPEAFWLLINIATPLLYEYELYHHHVSISSLSNILIKYMCGQNTKFGDSLVFHILSSISTFYLCRTILERGESQLQIMSFGPKTISTL